jgi:integrase
MPKISLSPSFLRGVRPPTTGQVEHADSACPGLRLRLSHGGTATWVLGCRDASGKMRRFKLGAYPAIGLAEARDLARQRREEVRRGADPIRDARRVRQVATTSVPKPASLAVLLDGYAKDVGARRRSWPEARRRIEDVFKAHLSRVTLEITAAELQLTVDAHGSRSSAGAAVRYIRPVLKWGTKRGLIIRGTGESLDQPDGALTVRRRRLSRDEMRAILRNLDQAGGYGEVLRWLFLTGCRLNEACDMRWQDVDLHTGLWTIPITKQDKVHVVPLPQQALARLRELLSVKNLVQHAVSAALVFTNTRGGKLVNWDRATKAVHRASSTSGWHRHDIRRSVASLMGDIGVPPHVIEVSLGHVLRSSSDGSTLSRVATVYNTSRYRREHAEALQQLADELDLIEQGSKQASGLLRV